MLERPCAPATSTTHPVGAAAGRRARSRSCRGCAPTPSRTPPSDSTRSAAATPRSSRASTCSTGACCASVAPPGEAAGLADALSAVRNATEQLACSTRCSAPASAPAACSPRTHSEMATDSELRSRPTREYQAALTPEQLTRFGNFLDDAANAQRERLKAAILATPPGQPITLPAYEWDTAYNGSRAAADRSADLLRNELVAASARGRGAGQQPGRHQRGDPDAGPADRHRDRRAHRPRPDPVAAGAARLGPRRRRAAAPGRPSRACAPGDDPGRHRRPRAAQRPRRGRPGGPRVRRGARAGRPARRRPGRPAGQRQRDVRQPLAPQPGAGRAPAAADRAAGEQRAGRRPAVEPLPARPPRHPHAAQQREPAGPRGHRPGQAQRRAGADGRRAAGRGVGGRVSTSGSSCRPRRRPRSPGARRPTSSTCSPSCWTTPPTSPRPTRRWS